MGNKYKCEKCLLHVNEADGVMNEKTKEICCPVCSEPMEKMCPNDHICTCNTEINNGVRFCSICGAPTCPCGSEDVVALSRITGYMSTIGGGGQKGWNAGKLAEFSDRHRYNVETTR